MGFSWMRGWDLSPDGSRIAVVSAHRDTAKLESAVKVDSAAEIDFGSRIDVLALSDQTWQRILAQPADRTSSADAPKVVRFYQIAWAADGNSFFVTAVTGDSFNLMHVTSNGKMHPLLGDTSFLNQFLADLLPSPDGKFLTFTTMTWEGNAWMIDNF